MLVKIKGKSKSAFHDYNIDINSNSNIDSKHVCRLMIIGKNEMFGLEEIMEDRRLRGKTV